MATTVTPRQPFAPLDGARLQNLTSLKNRQNAVSPAIGAKRKAVDNADTDDSENVDPIVFSKRSKGTGSPLTLSKEAVKASPFVLTKAASTPLRDSFSLSSPVKPRPLGSTSTPSQFRAITQAKSPLGKTKAAITKSSPLSAPAGRSPTHGKRSGILGNRRRTVGPFTRVNPPLFNASSTASAAPFSLDAALKGTIPSYAARSLAATQKPAPVAECSPLPLGEDLNGPDLKASWFFDIHEDTPEQEMTNMLQHGTCVLDISSDEESARKASREQAEGRDKENVPPSDDVSQTSIQRSSRTATDENAMIVEKERMALGDLDASAFYAADCDETSVIIVPADEDEEEDEGKVADAPACTTSSPPPIHPSAPASFEFAPDLHFSKTSEAADTTPMPAVETLPNNLDEPATNEATLSPIEGSGDKFELWEIGSNKDETEAEAADSGVQTTC